ncbi:hypothetical protein RB597_007847 [Gaeumannomyces tritici]
MNTDLMDRISYDAELIATKVKPFVSAHQSSLSLLAEVTRNGSLDANGQYHHAISSALEAVGKFLHFNTTLMILIAMKKDPDDLPVEWTEQRIQTDIGKAQAAIEGLEHTAKIEHALRVQNYLFKSGRLDNSNFRLSAIIVMLSAMWAWTHDDQRDPDIPGVDFGMAPFIHVSLDFLGRPQYLDGNDWIGMDEAPLAKMPGSNWGLFFREPGLPYFHNEVLDTMTLTIPHEGLLLIENTVETYTSVARQLKRVNQLLKRTPKHKKAAEEFHQAFGSPFSKAEPISQTYITYDYSEIWTGSLSGLKNISTQDETGCYRAGFITHMVAHVMNPEMPLGHYETLQTHLELTFAIPRDE